MSKNNSKSIKPNADNLLTDSQVIEEPMSNYQMAIFKKRIMWKATIFALKIVFFVTLLAIILLNLVNNN